MLTFAHLVLRDDGPGNGTFDGNGTFEGNGTIGLDSGFDGDMPATYPLLTTNLVCRILFGFLAILVCIVPLRLLAKNGEFAAVALIVTVTTLNMLTIVNALIWQNDDLASWWQGYGWCDFLNYFYNPILVAYTACFLAIMRNLAIQLSALRANALSSRERTRRNLIQALIILPVPTIQLIWIYAVSMQRYAIGTLVGCIWVPTPTWPYIVFFVLPAPVMGLATAVYSVLTYIRFRQIQKTTSAATGSNLIAASRAHRAQRRLFLMTLSILIPYLPLTCYYAANNIINSLPLEPFDYSAIHDPAMWNIISAVPSTQLEFSFLNAAYIPILTALPIFWFFGRTKDALNIYRRAMLRLRLDRVWPNLRREYDPDSSYGQDRSANSAASRRGLVSQRDSEHHTGFHHLLAALRIPTSKRFNLGFHSGRLLPDSSGSPFPPPPPQPYPSQPTQQQMRSRPNPDAQGPPADAEKAGGRAPWAPDSGSQVRIRVWADDRSLAADGSRDLVGDIESVHSANGVVVSTHIERLSANRLP